VAREGVSASEYARRREVPPDEAVAAGTAPASRRFVVCGGGLLVAVLVPLFVSLGNWQWQKAEVKRERQALLDARAAEAPVLLTGTAVDAEALRYRRVVVRGRFDAAHQILIDNRIHREQAGYQVITPLVIEDAADNAAKGLRVLVDRGWVAAGASRAQLPAIATPDGSIALVATAVVPGTRFFALGPQPARIDWQDANARVWPNLDLARYRQAVDFPLQPVILQLAPESPAGFVREWARPDERIERHVGYAWQWYGFALATLAIWLFFLLRPWLRRPAAGGTAVSSAQGRQSEPEVPQGRTAIASSHREEVGRRAPAAAALPQAPTPARRALLLTVLICLTPLLVGGGLYASGWRPTKTANHGTLLQPPQALPIAALGKAAAARASGKWLLLIAGDHPCDDRCVALVENTRKVQVALNRDMGRLVRIVLTPSTTAALAALQGRQPDLVVASPPPAWQTSLAPGGQHRIFLVDPAGNLMMQYAPDADAKGVHADLERLLKASWIG